MTELTSLAKAHVKIFAHIRIRVYTSTASMQERAHGCGRVHGILFEYEMIYLYIDICLRRPIHRPLVLMPNYLLIYLDRHATFSRAKLNTNENKNNKPMRERKKARENGRGKKDTEQLSSTN